MSVGKRKVDSLIPDSLPLISRRRSHPAENHVFAAGRNSTAIHVLLTGNGLKISPLITPIIPEICCKTRIVRLPVLMNSDVHVSFLIVRRHLSTAFLFADIAPDGHIPDTCGPHGELEKRYHILEFQAVSCCISHRHRRIRIIRSGHRSLIGRDHDIRHAHILEVWDIVMSTSRIDSKHIIFLEFTILFIIDKCSESRWCGRV